ncbi:hypothetical protein H310_06672 [Aphanomyces invadans]|uniref:Uncharacterized protein n=1 Tax=Aphanomyces invadans TaxID=157072 RepID=A0A024U3Q2_9STRA|nr:hypothetical protein H310_06672 [Aphanomyces invadans]ETW01041.1 hypothetical protein H310_06672 [Aphanomyces invadans]|eukprot:XP_008870039.1 hypothetical protein H310_06672 [Aphanomyces invadans]
MTARIRVRIMTTECSFNFTRVPTRATCWKSWAGFWFVVHPQMLVMVALVMEMFPAGIHRGRERTHAGTSRTAQVNSLVRLDIWSIKCLNTYAVSTRDRWREVVQRCLGRLFTSRNKIRIDSWQQQWWHRRC